MLPHAESPVRLAINPKRMGAGHGHKTGPGMEPSPPKPSPDWCYFLDFDGTLVDIAPWPDAVIVAPDLADLLSAVVDATGGAVAVVSGRPIREIDELLGGLPIRVAGQHGMELRLDPGGDASLTGRAQDLPAGVREELQALSARVEGSFVEDKGMSAALHYRAAPEHGDKLEQAVRALVAAYGGLLSLVPGKCVLEVKMAGVDKGSAVTQFLELDAFRGRRPVMIGDDITDEDAFRVVNRQGGVSIHVGDGSGITEAAFRLRSTADVHGWLARLGA